MIPLVCGPWARRIVVYLGCCLLFLAVAASASAGDGPSQAQGKVTIGVPQSFPPYYQLDEDGKPDPFWTVQRVALAAGILFILLLTVMGTWRYHSVVRLNRRISTSEEKFRNLIEGSIQGVLIHGIFKPLFANQTYAEIFGYENPEELLRESSALDHVAPGDRDRLRKYSESRIRDNDAPTTYEFQGVRKDGTLIWLENRVRVVNWEGQPAVQRTVVDITERKQAEEAVRESEERFRDLVEGSIQGIIIHRNFKPLFVNQAFADIFGYDDPEEMLALGSALVFRVTYEKERIRKYGETRLRGGEAPTAYEYQGLRKDGSVIWLDNLVRKIQWQGEPAIQATVVDITERKQAEKVVDAALQEAEMANQAKSEFLSSMSHELRTPLTAILGFANIMCQQYFGPISDKNREYANDIKSSGEHLLTLVNEILDLSALEAGKQSLAKENLSTMEIVGECERIVEEKARSLGINLITKVPKDLPPLYADRRASKQILLNLLSNAVKYTPISGKITVSAKASKRNTTLTIADTGKGIPAENLAKLTDPFTKTESDPYLAEQGWGLGLSITKSLVDLHDGTLDIKSKVGTGTTVTVTFPNEAP